MTDTDIDIEAVRAELEACEQVQSWAPGSTRSSWTDELRAIIEAGERLSEAVRQARERAWELAEQVARGLATDVDHLRDELQDSLSEQADSVDEALEDAETIAELVEAARAHGVTVDTAALGERDGYEVDETTAVAYATVRTWDGSYPYVQVDLLTGEATRHEG